MGKIYNVPSTIAPPVFNWQDIPAWQADEQRYRDEVKQWLTDNGYNGECAGEVIHFPVADGRAEYMVASLKPVALIHLAVGDAWNYEYAHRLTASDVKEKVKQQKALNDLFSKKS